MDNIVIDQSYIVAGVLFDADKKVLTIDTQKPLMIDVIGINEVTGEKKRYLLRVTPKGNLCLI